jgi:hypothetical protein
VSPEIDDNPRFSSSPEWFPWEVTAHGERVRSLRLTESDYRASSFLDHRIVCSQQELHESDWLTLSTAIKHQPIRLNYIFHISHVGSTLLSRLLGEHPAIFSLREPYLLRYLATVHPRLGETKSRLHEEAYFTRQSTLLKLWSRTFRPEQMSLLKATSFASELATELLNHEPASKAIAMEVTPVVFLKTMLGGAMSDMTSNGERRLERLHARIGQPMWNYASLSAGELVAMSWLCEVAALEDAYTAHPGRVLWVDFDQFLKDPARGLRDAFAHLGVTISDDFVQELLNGPILQRYAKAPDHPFDAETRRQLLEQAAVTHYQELCKGMEWLRQASRIPLVHRVFQSAANRQLQQNKP